MLAFRRAISSGGSTTGDTLSMAVSAAGASCEQRAMRAAAVASVSSGWTLQSVLFCFVLFKIALLIVVRQEGEAGRSPRTGGGGRERKGRPRRRRFPPVVQGESNRLATPPPPGREREQSQFGCPSNVDLSPPDQPRAFVFVPGTSSCARASDPERRRSRAREAAARERSMALFDCPRGATERSREEREKKRFVQRELIFLNSLLARKGKKRGKNERFLETSARLSLPLHLLPPPPPPRLLALDLSSPLGAVEEGETGVACARPRRFPLSSFCFFEKNSIE